MPTLFKLITFDWDGTLMDSANRIVESFQAAIQELRLASRTDEDIRQIIGLGLAEAVYRLYPLESGPRREQLNERYRYHYLYASQTPTPLFSGVAETLAILRKAGYLMAIATGKSRAGLNRALHETKLGSFFATTRTSEETRSKPHPMMLHEIMDELNVPAHDMLMVGDTEYDLQMAGGAGVSAIAVSYGVHDQARLMACRPLACLQTITELPVWLEKPRQLSVAS